MDNVMNLIKGLAKDAIFNNAEVAEDKKDLAIETAAGALTHGLSSNLSSLSGLLTGGGGGIIDTLKGTVANALTEKVGLNSALSGTIASTLTSMLVSNLSGQSGGGGLSLDSLMGALSSGQSSSKGGGILSTLAGLFGK